VLGRGSQHCAAAAEQHGARVAHPRQVDAVDGHNRRGCGAAAVVQRRHEGVQLLKGALQRALIGCIVQRCAASCFLQQLLRQHRRQLQLAQPADRGRAVPVKDGEQVHGWEEGCCCCMVVALCE
jgi:hypothetical protein